ncbi:MAG: dTDP-4-amino-4,6-dideoxygalactose transaminase [Pseudomonadota bacterium]
MGQKGSQGSPVPFNRVRLTGRELSYIEQLIHGGGTLSGDGPYTARCSRLLESLTASPLALLTHSCTAALEMAAILAELQPGDEVIMPSYTFVSTANAFVMRSAVPVFIDVRPDTFNIDESLIEAAITPRTRAICVVHYAGVACEMDAIMAIARRHGLLVIEDAAQALVARYRDRPLGSIGDFGCFSFHETKNLVSGEGGALTVNTPAFTERAEIIREKGTNRSRFFRGQVDKYTWIDIGSSYLPSELIAAFLLAQLEDASALTAARLQVWNAWHEALAPLEADGLLRRPVIPPHCTHNGHIYYALASSLEARGQVLEALKAGGIHAVFHYVPLHSAPAGIRFGRVHGDMTNTLAAGDRLFRVPVWAGLDAGVVRDGADILRRALA